MGATESPLLELIIYTDPYCTWCWGSEPVLRKIQEVYGGQVRLIYKMGGLVEDTSRFRDPLNRIGGPDMHRQVAEHWRQAAQRHGMPVDADIFVDLKNEFRSTWPACIAYKAAELAEPELAARYLRRLREAAAAEHMAINRLEVQADLAAEVGLDRRRFLEEIENGNAEREFRDDLEECRASDVTGFPSYEVHVPGGEEMAMFGFHNFAAFESTFQRLAGDRLKPREITADDESIMDFMHRYGKAAPREVSEVFSLKMGEARELLERLVTEGKLGKQQAGSGWFYLAPDILSS